MLESVLESASTLAPASDFDQGLASELVWGLELELERASVLALALE